MMQMVQMVKHLRYIALLVCALCSVSAAVELLAIERLVVAVAFLLPEPRLEGLDTSGLVTALIRE